MVTFGLALRFELNPCCRSYSSRRQIKDALSFAARGEGLTEHGMDEHKELWMSALHQALVISLAAAITECCRFRPGSEEAVIADCRTAIERDLGLPAGCPSEDAQAFRLTVMDAVCTILNVAEEQARVRLGLSHPSSTLQ